MTSDFDYKKYSLDKLQEWVHDAMNSDASPHEIYSAIREAVREDYYYHKDCISHASGLLALLSGHRPVADDELYKAALAEREYYEGKNKTLSCDKDDKSPECQKSWNDFWEENYYPEEHQQYTEEELNAMCDKAASDEEKNKCREYNLREAEYYNQRAKLDAKQDKVVKWQLPVEADPSGEYFFTFPDDLLEAANLKEGDQVEWIDQGDGSYLLQKVSNYLRMDEC